MIVIGILSLACFAMGFAIAWLVRTAWVMTQISWSQERMENRVRYWQGEAIHARKIAADALRQLAAIRGETEDPAAPPDPWAGDPSRGDQPPYDQPPYDR